MLRVPGGQPLHQHRLQPSLGLLLHLFLNQPRHRRRHPQRLFPLQLLQLRRREPTPWMHHRPMTRQPCPRRPNRLLAFERVLGQ